MTEFTLHTTSALPDAADDRVALLDLDRAQLTDFVVGLGEPKFRAAQIWDWIYTRYAGDFDAMHNLPKSLRTKLAAHALLDPLTPVTEVVSQDRDTLKALFRLPDGQTIEIINTDAEGRLVLADVLWYVQDKYKPQFMVDLATLTGAIMVALGQEYAGLFSNNDELSERLRKSGEATGEKVWRMPLAPAYDKMIDSKFADMKNTGGRYGGSITAAQFLQRYVEKTPWAHLDIAGTGMGSPSSDINQSWGSGWGVRLLDRLVKDFYEG